MAKIVLKHISAITGRYVTEEFAKQHPQTTVGMKVKVGPTKHRK